MAIELAQRMFGLSPAELRVVLELTYLNHPSVIRRWVESILPEVRPDLLNEVSHMEKHTNFAEVAASMDLRKQGNPELGFYPGSVIYDGEPYPIPDLGLAYLRGVFEAGGKKISGKQIATKYGMENGCNVRTAWLQLPKELQARIEVDNKHGPHSGSRWLTH